MRQKIDVRIVVYEQRKHRASDVSVVLVDGQEHCHAGARNQLSHSLPLGGEVRHEDLLELLALRTVEQSLPLPSLDGLNVLLEGRAPIRAESSFDLA